jgi:tetratricopeptide (TPR) repeat protein
MRGDLKSAWPYVWSDIWVRLYETKGAPVELFAELYAALVPKPRLPVAPPEPTAFDADGKMNDPIEIELLAEFQRAMEAYNQDRLAYEKALTAEPDDARRWLRDGLQGALISEADAVSALEKAFAKIDDIGGDALSNRYVNLVQSFIEKYNLRYDLRRPFSLHPTISGVFTQLVSQLKQATASDAHLNGIMGDFEESFRDLKAGATPARIKACISRQANLLEAIGQIAPNVTGNTLGAICDQVGTWPHEKLKESVKCMYKFSNEFPGIRHAGTPASQVREIDMRDLVAVSVVLTGFAPYLTDRLNPEGIYGVGQ